MNQNIKKALLLFLPLCMLTVLIYSCKKELSGAAEEEVITFTVAEARKYHNSTYKSMMEKSATASVSSTDNRSFSGGSRMGWRLAKSFKKGDLEMVEVPISFKKRRMRAYSFGGGGAKDISDHMMLQAAFHRYVIYKSKSGKVSRRILTFMPDKSYISKYGMDASKNGVNHLEKTFSGYVEYNDSGYRPLFVYRVKDGKVLQRLDLRKRVKVVSKKKGVGVSSDCEECEPEYEVVCEEIEDPDATNGVGWECTDVFIGLNCYPMPCPGGGGEDPDDCSNPNNADLPECSFEDEEECEYYGTCDDGGGNDCGYSVNSKGMRVKNNCGEPTTPVVDIIDLITDPNADCILSNLLNNTFFNNLVHDFKNNKNLNLTFTMGSPVDNYGNPVTGQTSHSYGTTNFTITINQSYFNQVGGLEATKTFMHEAFHANLWIKAQEWYPTDLPANFQNLSLVAQIQYLDQRGGNSGPQHDYMASEVNSIATALQSYTQAHYPAVYSNPNISFESYKAMAYRGLEMTERYTDYVNSLQGGQSSFNSFYGLLAAGTQSKCP